MTSEIHAVYFYKKDGWDTAKARAWLKREGITPRKRMRYEGEQMRYSIVPKERFTHFTTKIVGNGIHIVLGWHGKKVVNKKSGRQRGRGGMDLTGFAQFIGPQLASTGWGSQTLENISSAVSPFSSLAHVGVVGTNLMRKFGY